MTTKRGRAPLLVGCFFCATVLCVRHATPGGSAKAYPPGVHKVMGVHGNGYRSGAWWCDDCNTAMDLPVQWWTHKELAEMTAKRKAKGEAGATRKMARQSDEGDV